MSLIQRFRRFVVCLAAGCCGLPATTALAQSRSQAIPGRPFGVGELTLPLPESLDGRILGANRFQITEKNGRILYPAIAPGRLGELVGQVLGEGAAASPSRLNVSFLFTGTEPLELTLWTPEPQPFVLTPSPPRRPREFDRAMTNWWKDYNAVARQHESEGDYPPVVETYLTSMLSGRLGLRPPLLTRMQQPQRSELEQVFGLLLGVEDLRFAVLRETMQGGGGLGEAATLPLPPAVDWQPLALPEIPQVGVEPIALHVPQECFYIRFGSFENYLWFDRLKDDYGGDISQMVTLRGHNAQLDEKVQRQLALKQSALAEVMGPQFISDVALIGRDLYMREGPALGMLFEAKNSDVLLANFQADRVAALQEWQQAGATLETVSIAGRDVSLLSTPDNRLRSFHAVDGRYHLVTTSRAIVEAFFAAGAGGGSLGASAEFLHARWRMPLERDDTLFAYFSSAFFRSLLSPQYQIELTRRLQSVTDMELVTLAQLAATAEGRPHETLDELIAGGFLPRDFGQRGGEGPPLETGHGGFDPRRGARGTFTPIPDVPITAITPAEAELYNRANQFLQTQWPQMDPLMIGVKRYALEPERMERIVIDANVSPIAEEKYGWVLSLLGPPVQVEIQSDPADVLTMQMSLKGGLLWPAIPAHQVFLGVQDLEPSLDAVPGGGGLLQTLQILHSTPGYLGAWPQLGLLDMLPLLSPQPDVLGFSQLPLGLWRWQGNGFSVLSYDRGVLGEAAGFLRPVPTGNPAQIQIRVSDLAHSRLAGWISTLSYNRALQASVGNVKLLNALSRQLRMEPSQTLGVANHLLDTQLVCPLGGEYEFHPDSEGHWESTAWPAPSGVLPDDYAAPLLEWFRGASVDLTKEGSRMFLHAEVDMLRKEREPAVTLPLFDFFSGNKRHQTP